MATLDTDDFKDANGDVTVFQAGDDWITRAGSTVNLFDFDTFGGSYTVEGDVASIETENNATASVDVTVEDGATVTDARIWAESQSTTLSFENNGAVGTGGLYGETVTVENNGVIDGLFVEAITADLTNTGTILGLEWNAVSGTIHNSGYIYEIQIENLFFELDYVDLTGAEFTEIVNDGTIEGRAWAILSVGNVRIVNSGDIVGDDLGIYIFSGTIHEIINSGTIKSNGISYGTLPQESAAIWVEAGETTLTNSGTIIGDVWLLNISFQFDGATIINTGTIDGDVYMESTFGFEGALYDGRGGTVTGVVTAGLGDDILRGGDGTETFVGLDGIDTIHGGGGDDVIYGGENRGDAFWDPNGAFDFLYGGAGDDKIYDAGRSGEIYGGQGNDTLHGGAYGNFLQGGQGDDVVYGGSGWDTVRGGQGNDRVFGNTGRDWVYGNDGDDFVSGGNGRDVISGGTGNDTLEGGAGDDRFKFGTDAGDDNIIDFEDGSDLLDISALGVTDLALLDAAISDQGADAVVNWTVLGGSGTLTIEGAAGLIDGSDFLL